jgi:hypothetical protein
MKKSSASFSLTVLLVMILIGVTAWVLFASKPEVLNLVSDDGLLAISGTSNNAKFLYIASHQNADGFTVYTLSPESLAKQADLRIAHTGEEQLFALDDVREVWRPVESTLQSKGHSVFALGQSQEIALADYSAWMDEMLAAPPEHAVAYEQFFTYQVEEALPSYFVENSMRQASCKDLFFDSKHVEEKKEEKEIRIPVDGVNRLVHLTLVTKWFINRGSDTCAFVTQK